ncbi:phosphoribosylaminoimidazole-succinocarboxamide synthase [Synechococcus sp. PCC 7502]|uniref:phosphoribosylaminoimidazolesuccinocarboxamide synthase n=1 Tax=Synechococcus sp. PCC 7502 TaxID=1173263 RepID=UPI00029FF6D9|nr:phosphoribosylaminoimidazolesuccinocarboxamide synthase [Synechococcus sp. PCC 7502]AFY74097.1 phosphoribosylaminoimidazole-succinocarboxamide synthase [Synechococcus sp. PCC 7502]
MSQKLYEGKAKILYTTDKPEILLTHFKDDATAFNAQKKGQITRKGEINCAIATHLFQFLENQGIPTHFIAQTAPNQMEVAAVKILPLEVVVRNIAAGSFVARTGITSGTVLKYPLVEFFYKNDDLGDPLFTEDHIQLLELATPTQVTQLKQMALTINQYLQQFFSDRHLTLVDFKLEFGLDSSGKILLADEISPDTCRLWDTLTTDPKQKIMDKDRFRQDLGNVAAAYEEVLARVMSQN